MSVHQKWKYEVPQKWKKVFIWYKVLIVISQEVEKGIYLVKGKNRDFPGSENELPGSGKTVFTW